MKTHLQLLMKKTIQLLISFSLCFLTLFSLKLTKTVLAANVWNNATPSKQYQDLSLKFKTTPHDLIILTRTNKKRDLKFKLTAASRDYTIMVPLNKVNFKKKSKHLVNTRVIKSPLEGKTTIYKGSYSRIKQKNKKYVYIFSLTIPLKSLDSNLSPSAIMKIVPITSKSTKTSITNIGLSTFPIIPVIICILILVWIYVLSVLKRAKIFGLYFWVSSISTFVILTFLFHHQLSYWMSVCISWVMAAIGNTTHLFTTVANQNLMYLFTQHNLVQISIDYECSGMLEFLVFECLLIFYPIFSPIEKVLRSLEGFLWITGANVLRIMLVILSVKYINADSISLTNLVASRIIFYMLTIILYYNVFTKNQIIRGWRNR